MKLGKQDCQELDRALSLEWLETNGRGGFSSGTISGANTRRYHALLLTSPDSGRTRYVLVNQIEEWLQIDGEAWSLSTNLYPGAVHPHGYRHCISFTSTPWPTWMFMYNGTACRREIICIQGYDLVVVRWTVVESASQILTLMVRPMLTGRDYHALHHENRHLLSVSTVTPEWVSWQPYHSLPPVHSFHTGRYRHTPDWYRQVQFPLEKERGLDFQEDWWSPGEFAFEFGASKEHVLAFTSEPMDTGDVMKLIHCEHNQRMNVHTGTTGADCLIESLREATTHYVVQQGTKQTVIAGYPWFTDWGRDTFISLPGLCLVTGRYEVAWEIIRSFSSFVSEGMVPNRFPDAGKDPEYNSIDASLWFIDAIDRYLAYSHDVRRVQSVAWPAIKQILDGYRRGTRYSIHMDIDGLIAGGTPGTQLTWMDAKVGDWVVTPRHGKPVEIQALWMKALDIGARLATRFREASYARGCREDRARAVESFRTRFWYEDGQYLYDTIDGPTGDDTSIRPNQVYAVSLCDDVLTRAQASRVLQIVKEHLLTPVGLRTLSPQDARYCPRYEGGPVERDGAYHQGTVWPFLLGPFLTSWVRIFGSTVDGKNVARSFLHGLEDHIHETCLGQISEIFDGEPPHRPRGCPAQAWSIAEPLRVMVEDLGLPITTVSDTRRGE
ncbi:MAG: amylo-alpha-1,6-glucosidase [Nitrospira sp.]|nr:amylo-alpha-1,6-glucosidase [Nitrospira sp.]